jgi:hypothetical protein
MFNRPTPLHVIPETTAQPFQQAELQSYFLARRTERRDARVEKALANGSTLEQRADGTWRIVR